MTKDLADGFENNSVHDSVDGSSEVAEALYYSGDSRSRRFRLAPLTALLGVVLP